LKKSRKTLKNVPVGLLNL